MFRASMTLQELCADCWHRRDEHASDGACPPAPDAAAP